MSLDMTSAHYQMLPKTHLYRLQHRNDVAVEIGLGEHVENEVMYDLLLSGLSRTHSPQIPPSQLQRPSSQRQNLPSQSQLPPTQPQVPPSQPQHLPSQPQHPPTQTQCPPFQPQHPPSQPQHPPTQTQCPPSQPQHRLSQEHPPSQPQRPPSQPPSPTSTPRPRRRQRPNHRASRIGNKAAQNNLIFIFSIFQRRVLII